ncbi:MAG: hypothetical protein U1E99_11110 [Agitococcus sp.]
MGEIDGSRTSTLQRMVDRLQPQDIILRFDKIECWRKADLPVYAPVTNRLL